MLVASLTYMRILLPVVAALAPLLVAPRLLFYFDVTPKILVLIFGAVAALILAMLKPKPLDALIISRIGRWFCILLAAQVLSLAISTLVSTNPWLSLNGGNWRRFGLLAQTAVAVLALLSAAYLVQSRWRLRPLLRTIVVTGGVIAIYGCFQYFRWDPLQPSGPYHIGEGIWAIVRPPSTLGHADYFGSYLLFIVFIGAAVLMTDADFIWKVLSAVAAGAAAFAVVLSGTRAAVVGLLIGGGLFVVWLQPRMRIVYLVLTGSLLASLIAFYYSPPGAQLRARMRWSREDVRGGARLLLWRDSLHMAAQRPWLGYGPETFPSEFPRFQSVELARAYPDFYHESPHNVFLDALTAQGLPGLLILAAISLLGLYAAASARFVEPILARALGSCLVAVLVAQQFTAFIAANGLYFGLLVGILVSLAPHPQSGVHIAGSGYVRPGLTVCALGTIVALTAFGVRLFLADSNLQKVKNDFDNLRVAAAAHDYERVTHWYPAGSSADLFYSRGMAALAPKVPYGLDKVGASQEALNAAVRATQTSEDRMNAWYNLAALNATRNDAGAVERSLRASIACAPNWFKPHWMLAQVLSGGGRLQEAETEALAAVDLDGGRHAEVNQTLDQIRAASKMKGR